MYYHDKRLQYPVTVDAPDPQFARMLQQAIGGVEGEIRVCMQYFFQAWGNRSPDPRYRDMLLNTATEEIGHIEMLATAVALNLDKAPASLQEEGAADGIVGAVMGGERPRHVIEGMIHKNLLSSGLAAMQGNAIQNNAANLFKNASMPSGVLTAPGAISDETAARLKRGWEDNFNGKNFGKVAILGDGLKFDMMSMKATDAQMIEQLKWTADVVCSTFHVPPYKIGVGQQPTYNNVQALNVEYYSQCLQRLIEDMESCLDAGLGFGERDGVETDLTGLLRMDSSTRIT
jgi:Mn-containing catalase